MCKKHKDIIKVIGMVKHGQIQTSHFRQLRRK